ncbi:MAG TPA: 4-hydroxyphenylacetate 3-hydroxylase N-terminal domain-containing protein [Dehalococcoidia bacterium]|nr:4-hydroxyphenylacetate 3-hydroxylase N-terminal domain-containing protein [Dehalococcoidia bacterium]
MSARSGKQYVESLRERQPHVYLNGRRVADVTAEPAFQGALESIAQQYDMQLMPVYNEIMTFQSPSTGEPVSTSYMLPRSKDELIKMRKHFKLRTDHNFGFLGRGPDFMNCLVSGWSVNREVFARGGRQYADNAVRYHEYVREHDLFLTHMLINPQTDRSRTSADQEDPFMHLGRVQETPLGIVVRGAKMLATMAPLCEEVVVIPGGGGVAKGDDAYAVSFAIPNNTPGLSYICREPVTHLPRSRFDHPLSSRFEEMDCIGIFEDVLVPWDRVIVDGKPGSADIVNSIENPAGPTSPLQAEARLLSTLEFFCGLAMKLADSIGITGFLHVQEKLGEMLSYLEVCRGLYYGAEAMAREAPTGIWVPGGMGLAAFHYQASAWVHRRMVEVIQTLAGGGFFYAPTEADLQSEELRPKIDKYVRGRPGISAEERIALFRLAWDATGEAFGQRLQQYVHYYSGDPVRNAASLYLTYDKEPLFDIVERALGRRPDLDIALSPDAPGVPSGKRAPAEAVAGHYPAASHPQPARNPVAPAGS